MWFEERAMYHIYPLGLCGAPEENDGVCTPRIRQVGAWAEHIKKLGCGTVYFGPLLDSDTHGYNTRDYGKLDPRLGRNADFIQVCHDLHSAGLRVVLDGVFNHVGRGFWAFQDVLKNREGSPYRDWFFLDFHRDSNYGDGLWYEGWEGHYDLVKLNLRNPRVVEHLLENVKVWIELFGIDGLRLDVAYMLDRDFLRQLRRFTDRLRPDFFLFGEMIHGDYRQIVNGEMLHSATNYECFKGLYSSFNAGNMHEIGYSLNRQFGPEHWTLYRDLRLVVFADNHDVARLASTLEDRGHLVPLYGLMYGMPGIPCLYYGSEWGIEGAKENGSDKSLRPSVERPLWTDLTDAIAAFAGARNGTKALALGDYRQIHVAGMQLAFLRQFEGERVLVAVNSDRAGARVPLGEIQGPATDLLTGETCTLSGTLDLPEYGVRYLKLG